MKILPVPAIPRPRPRPSTVTPTGIDRAVREPVRLPEVEAGAPWIGSLIDLRRDPDRRPA